MPRSYDNTQAFRYDKSKLRGVYPPVSNDERYRYEKMARIKYGQSQAQAWTEPLERIVKLR
jgi:hypothetical protein